jgi:PAS domain S-box-containing protein
MDKYKYFFYHNLDLACFANLDGYFEELNESFTNVLGYTSADLLNKKFFEFIHPEDIGPTMKIMESLADGNQAVNFVNRFRCKSGIYKYLEWNSTVDAETKKIFAIARDVTEKVLAEHVQLYDLQERESRAAELFIANKALAFQNEEKELRASELIIANKELAFQNKEKEDRANELIIANKKIALHNDEKENRARELIIANKELAFQNAEKEIRAAELIIANKELAFQNTEKENRAAELRIANKELAFQNIEKEIRARELIVANKELAFQNKEKEKRAIELKASNNALKKAKEFLTEHIRGLENMLSMTSHGVRQPVANILGIIQLLDKSVTSPAELKKLMDYIKEAALALDTFTKRLTVFMFNLVQKDANRVHELH